MSISVIPVRNGYIIRKENPAYQQFFPLDCMVVMGRPLKENMVLAGEIGRAVLLLSEVKDPTDD